MSGLPRDRRKSKQKSRGPMLVPGPAAPEEKVVLPEKSHFPQVHITGGPHGKNLHVEIDGEVPRKVHRIELEAAVNDIIRLRTFQFVEVHADLDIVAPGQVKDAGYIVEVRAPDVAEGAIRAWSEIATGRGQTLKDALLAAAGAIPEDFDVNRGEDEAEQSPEVH